MENHAPNVGGQVRGGETKIATIYTKIKPLPNAALTRQASRTPKFHCPTPRSASTGSFFTSSVNDQLE